MTPALIASALVALAAAPVAAPPPPPPPPVAEWLAVDPANTLIIETSKGRVVVEMHHETAPLHVARMKALARQGKMTNMPFYRVLPGFMAQGGNMKVASGLPNLKQEFEFTATPALYASVGPAPGKEQEGDFGFVRALPIKLDPGGSKGHTVFCPGVAAFAHELAKPDSANAQYFFMRGRASNLDATFSAWGRVILGREVVAAIQDGSPPPTPDTIKSARVMADIPAAQRPAIEVMDTRGPAFAEVLAKVKAERREVFSVCDVEVPARTPGA